MIIPPGVTKIYIPIEAEAASIIPPLQIMYAGPAKVSNGYWVRSTTEGQGIMTTKDGKTATWTGHGVGTMKKDGTATYRGALYFQTMPQKWSRLNKVAVLFEYAVDAGGNTHSEYWEWK